MKKAICTFLSLTLILTAFSGCDKSSQSAAEGTVADSRITPNAGTDFVYSESGGTITITGYKGSSTVVNIPSEIGGKKVVSIGEYAFDGYEEPAEDSNDGSYYQTNNINSITSIHIPSTVKTIETGAFTNCFSLTELTFAEGVESLAEGAFACCDSLAEVYLPNSLEEIGSYAFYECYVIQNVYFGSQVQSIGDYAFYNCNNLAEIDLPDTVNKIGEGCFAGCDLLTKVTIPDSVTAIPDYCFADTNVTEFSIPEGITSLGIYSFCRNPELTSVSLPDSLVSIGEKAFYNCEALKEITVPDSVSEIGQYALGYTYDSADESDEEKEITLPDFTLSAKSGSAAEEYAKENSINYK